jgi:hypothetical protein
MNPALSNLHMQQINKGSILYAVQSPIDWLLRRQWIYEVPLGPWHSADEIINIRQGVGLDRLDAR